MPATKKATVPGPCYGAELNSFRRKKRNNEMYDANYIVYKPKTRVVIRWDKNNLRLVNFCCRYHQLKTGCHYQLFFKKNTFLPKIKYNSALLQ